jgi:hypothetical protein
MRKDFVNQVPETHESYGLISISRTQGSSRSLFGSNIKHSDTIRLTISEAGVYRDYQQNRYHPNKELIEVEMSSSQFAEAMTSLNVGTGVPVTLRYVTGTRKEDPPDIDFKARAKNELQEEMKELAEKIETLSKDANDILSGTGAIKASDKKKMLQDIMFLVQEVRSNIPFAHECFQRSVNETVVQAKAEVDNCLTIMKEKLGDKYIQGQIQVPMLDA